MKLAERILVVIVLMNLFQTFNNLNVFKKYFNVCKSLERQALPRYLTPV